LKICFAKKKYIFGGKKSLSMCDVMSCVLEKSHSFHMDVQVIEKELVVRGVMRCELVEKGR
jgi:hypothetical protein